MHNHSSSNLNRREFIKLSGLSLAVLAAGCNRTQAVEFSQTGQLTDPFIANYKGAAPAPPPAGVPDVILRNGKILTVDASSSIVQAVAVKDGRILAVGSDEIIDALKGDSTQVIDLSGRVVTPGLYDPHCHLVYNGILGSMVEFLGPEIKTLQDMQKKLKDIAEQTPKGEWIQGYFFTFEEGRLPTRYDIDAATTEHPVWLTQQGGHLGSANSLALQLAGITAQTPNPMGAVIGRDQNGEPTGEFYNHRAMDMLRKVTPPRDPDLYRQGVIGGTKLLASTGVTTFHDNYARGLEVINAYINADKNGELVIPGAVYPVMENPGDIPKAAALEHYHTDRMRLGGYKYQIDGTGMAAYCHEPHNGVSWDMPAWDADIFKEGVKTLHNTGLQICVHCIGDAAIDLTLDAFEEAMNANPRSDPRHRIEHCVLTKPASIQRIADLGVVVSESPTFIPMSGNYFIKTFGEERKERLLVTRELLEAGIPVTINSDYPSTPWYTPQVTIASVMSRLLASKEVLNPDQQVNFMEALRMQTLGGAFAGFDEGIKGSIEPGKMADFAVWHEDPTTADPLKIANMTVDLTIAEGKVVHQV